MNLKVGDIIHHKTNMFDGIGKIISYNKYGVITCEIIVNFKNWSTSRFSFNIWDKSPITIILKGKDYPEYFI